jgi:hypothetical protein
MGFAFYRAGLEDITQLEKRDLSEQDCAQSIATPGHIGTGKERFPDIIKRLVDMRDLMVIRLASEQRLP